MGCNPKRIHHQANQEKSSCVQYDAIKDNILPHKPLTKTMHNTTNSQKEISTSNGMLHMTFQCPSGHLPCQARDAKSPPEAMSTSDHMSQISQSTSYVKPVQVTLHVSKSPNAGMAVVALPAQKTLRGGHVLSTCPSVEVNEDHVLLDVM